ncbi:hypothetical protein E2C01_077577 [Portunus trituberculatus]|uniref:Uncharacterized protein n=1 Tax=Portunus trituberculatus TaxID=210409 RepID=A0A5B7IEU1_PORTR|nr:hypothetical protein [Portunus trituberculatus]
MFALEFEGSPSALVRIMSECRLGFLSRGNGFLAEASLVATVITIPGRAWHCIPTTVPGRDTRVRPQVVMVLPPLILSQCLGALLLLMPDTYA